MNTKSDSGIDHIELGALAQKMGITLLHASANRVVARMPVSGNTQPSGILHGGGSVVLAESVGSIGAMLQARSLDTVSPLPFPRIALGLDINATHLNVADTGQVVEAVANAVKLGQTVATYEVVIRIAETDKMVCSARITCLIVPGKN